MAGASSEGPQSTASRTYASTRGARGGFLCAHRTASMVEAIYREGGGRYDDAYLSTRGLAQHPATEPLAALLRDGVGHDRRDGGSGGGGAAGLWRVRILGLLPARWAARPGDGGEHDDRDGGVDAAPRPPLGSHRRNGRRHVRSSPCPDRPLLGRSAVRRHAVGGDACLDASGHGDRDASPL